MSTSISQAFLPEFDHEMATTRRVLERLPEDRLGWQPHPKSMTLGRLASHIAELLLWAGALLHQDSFDLAPPEGSSYKPSALTTRQEILDLFDKSVSGARAGLAELPDEQYGKPWTLKRGGKAIFTQSRAAVVRSMLLNHIVHHRGQLSVYLRLTDTPVPSIYGPTADEGIS